MKLATYLERTGTTTVALAAKLGVSNSAVSRWARGIRQPRADIALAIERLTGGRVRVRDLLAVAPAAGRRA